MNTRLVFGFPKAFRLRFSSQYRRMARDSKKWVGEWIVVEKRQGKGGPSKLGITITRREGKSHDRNRFKRIVREAFRLAYPQLPEGLEILVRPRSAAMKAKMQHIQADLFAAIL